jgi:hypothetical protein
MAGLSRSNSEPEPLPSQAERDLRMTLVPAVFGGAMNYHELSPDGRELSAAERASALEQLTTGAMAIVTIERERELAQALPADIPIEETLMALRVMQQGLIFALSEDPAVRARAIDAYTALMYTRLAEAPWKAYLARREAARRPG